jgi:tetratricopeptide (TPR) repeat protein
LTSAAPRLRVCLAILLGIVPASPSPAHAQADAIARAKKLDAQGDQAAAIALYRQALARAPRSFDANYGIARALDLKGDYEEARMHFSAAIEAAADDGSRDQALRMLGVSWTFSRNARQAAQVYTRVYDRRDAAGDFAGAAEVANELGRVLLELGDFDGSTQWYRTGYTAALRQPSRTAVDDLAELRWAHAQARIAIRRGNAAEAKRAMDRVKTLVDKATTRDQLPQYAYLAGYVAYYAGNDREAIAQLQQADQQDPFILLLLAQAHQRLGERSMAREYYEKVMASTSHAVNNALARPIARRALAN